MGAKVTCERCDKPTWTGCGEHIEGALGESPGVPGGGARHRVRFFNTLPLSPRPLMRCGRASP